MEKISQTSSAPGILQKKIQFSLLAQDALNAFSRTGVGSSLLVKSWMVCNSSFSFGAACCSHRSCSFSSQIWEQLQWLGVAMDLISKLSKSKPRARSSEEENVSGIICSVPWPERKELFTAACSPSVCSAAQACSQKVSAPPQGDHFTVFTTLPAK